MLVQNTKLTDIEMRKELRAVDKEKVALKEELLQKLKYSFKHITGMWPKTASFKSEEERLLSWQTTQVIKQKVFKPSKRLVICEAGVNDLYREK